MGEHTQGNWKYSAGSGVINAFQKKSPYTQAIARYVNRRDGYLMAGSKALLEAAEAAHEHVSELEEAWRRGAISEHDRVGIGGERSNRNADVRRELFAAITAARPEAATKGGDA